MRNLGVERPLDFSPLCPLGQLLQVLVLGTQLLKFRPDCIGGSAPGEVDKLRHVILVVSLRKHGEALKLL
jgi:hypothetical protein